MNGKEVKKTNHIYLITVDDRNNVVNSTADSIIQRTERCVEFRNDFGFIQQECGDRISITQLQ